MKQFSVILGGLAGATLLAGAAWLGRSTPSSPREPAAVPSGASSALSAPAAPSAATIAKADLPPSNRTAYIPPQCYARTRDKARTYNGCFACHQDSLPPNYTNDEDVQTTLSFARAATENRWANALHPPPPAEIDDEHLLALVRSTNYFDPDGGITLARVLAHPRPEWDADANGRFDGFVPDCYFHPDDDGFDHAPDGRATGWRAFAYAPFPGMFWPTNGSAGDVLIRLPDAFRKNAQGEEDVAVYRVNLAIVEAYMRRTDVPIPAADEKALDADLDGDGRLGTARRVAFVWPAKKDRPIHLVGGAAALDPAKEGRLVPGLFPLGTEFLHTLRYLDVDDRGAVRMAARMKEVRYMRKARVLTYADFEMRAQDEAREKQKNQNRLKQVGGDAERGMGNGLGWVLQSFIEDAGGDLRPQTVEETLACVGCHGGVGASNDSTFAFARKLGAGAYKDGWYHWGDRGLAGIPEPRRADGRGEYAHWLEQVGGGDDFRTNDEVRARFFGKDGKLVPAAVQRLAGDIATLLVPSKGRALALDRAYLAVVRGQSFTRGRDVHVGGEAAILDSVVQDDATGIEEPIKPGWKREKPSTRLKPR